MEEKIENISQIEAPEEMASFFNKRAEGYDDHMRNNIESYYEFYPHIATPIEESDKQVKFLDLGCGTGLELEYIFKKAPHAFIKGVDMSSDMISTLYDKYSSYRSQIDCIVGSYLEVEFGEEIYDYIVSVMTMHHLLYDEKKELYMRIRRALKPGGKYIEGDFVVNEKDEMEYFKEYVNKMSLSSLDTNKLYHIDIPFTVEKQKILAIDSGFKCFDLIYESENSAVYTMTKAQK